LQQRLGITSIYVTHDQTEAMSLSDRIVVMDHGRVKQIGTPEEIYQRPSSVFVADFIGRANFVETQVLGCQDGCATVMLLGKRMNLPCSSLVHANQDAYAVIRPEAIKLTDSPGDLIGEVKTAIYFGSQVEYQVEINSQQLMVIDNDPQVGHIYRKSSQVTLSFDPLRCYVLPHEN
jgi:iron(III) transport system ATP-binding protein